MSESNTGISKRQRRKLRAHFGFSKLPFNKAMWAKQMFDSESQRELGHGLEMWTEIAGFGLVTGHSGVGKSISLRRFVADLDESRFNIVQFAYMPTTVSGFLRSLARALGLKMHRYGADLFDDARAHLTAHESGSTPHPIIILDDAEGLSIEILDVLRRLTTSVRARVRVQHHAQDRRQRRGRRGMCWPPAAPSLRTGRRRSARYPRRCRGTGVARTAARRPA